MDNNKLLFLRKRNDLTQDEMGKIIGVTKHSIYNWEKGLEIIPLKHLNTYANYFNVSIDYILNLSDNKETLIINSLNKSIIGKNIKKIRKDNNLTQRELAKILNTDHSTIVNYENGKTLILTAFAYQICKTFHLSMDELCGRSKQKIAL